MSKAAYEIRVAGEIPPGVLDDFREVSLSVDPSETALRVDQADEAELQGILDTIRRHGLELIAVRREQSVRD